MKRISIPNKSRIFFLGLQQFSAVIVALCIATIALNAYVTVEGLNGNRYYSVAPFEEQDGFEETSAFTSMLRDAIRDISRIAVIRSQMETDGKFDGTKIIDVSSYAKRKEENTNETVTAVYRLEDLLKWNMYGVGYTQLTFESRMAAVIYFDEHALDTYVMESFSERTTEKANLYQIEQSQAIADYFATKEASEEINTSYTLYDYYVDMAFEDMLEEWNQYGIAYSITGNAEDGTERITVNMLEERYLTSEGWALTSLANSWREYGILQGNVLEAISSLAYNHREYQKYNDYYSAESSNIKYCVKLVTDGEETYYSNEAPGAAGMPERDQHYREYGRYIIFNPGNMVYESNTALEDQELLDIFNTYRYAYSEMMKIWIGVDTEYPIAGDAMALGHTIYAEISNAWLLVGIGAVAMIVWLVLLIYLSVTAGRDAKSADGAVHINWFDRIHTEFALAMGGIASAGYLVIIYILDRNWDSGLQKEKSFGIVIFMTLLFSCTFTMFWYSLIRRIKAKLLWKYSLLCGICNVTGRAAGSLLKNKSVIVRIVVPFLGYLGVNGALVFNLIFLFDSRELNWCIVYGLLLLGFNLLTGRVLVKNALFKEDIIHGINRIRDGEIDYQIRIEKMRGENLILAEAVNNIGDGIRKAVETSMKDERMKADLITNVSHDIKTPLTSIVNYVDLLKRENITEEPVRGYIEVLEAKSQRLKQLTEDLVEASKISSGNITLNMEKINLTELLNQSVGEFSEKFEEKNLLVVMEYDKEPCVIEADSRRIWRVMENLFNNIYKYAMEGTRIYIDLFKNDMPDGGRQVQLSIKNISSQQLNINAEELTERFIRGDISRSTEGSGLGLSIAKTLTEAQKGGFGIHLDGDLFKVTLTFTMIMPEEREPDTDTLPPEN